MQHKKERGERTKGRKKNKTCFTNIFVIFFVFFFYFFFFGQRKNLQCRWAEAPRWHWMKINELRLDEFVELPAMISPKRGRERQAERWRELCARPLQFAAWPHSIAVRAAGQLHWLLPISDHTIWVGSRRWPKTSLVIRKGQSICLGLASVRDESPSISMCVCVSLGVSVWCVCVCCRPWLCLFAVRWTQCK